MPQQLEILREHLWDVINYRRCFKCLIIFTARRCCTARDVYYSNYVCSSVKLEYCVKTAKFVVKLFHRLGMGCPSFSFSHAKHCDEIPRNYHEPVWRMKNVRFGAERNVWGYISETIQDTDIINTDGIESIIMIY